jgi:hypothetical protein
LDDHRFDQLTRALTGPRRTLFSGALVIAAGWLGVAGGEAKKPHKPKHKPKKAKPNEFGCLEVGDPCNNADQCCSGICQGKKGKKQCRAHGTGVCDQTAEGICTAANPNTTVCDNTNICACIRTTAGSNFCSQFEPDPKLICADCQKDADCVALGFPAGSACVPLGIGSCAHACESGMACFPPCGVEFPTR